MTTGLNRLTLTLATTDVAQPLSETTLYAAYVCLQAAPANGGIVFLSSEATAIAPEGRSLEVVASLGGGQHYSASDHCGRNIFDLSTLYMVGDAGSAAVVIYWVNPAYSDRDMFHETQYHLLEDPNNGMTLSTDIWTMTDWLDELDNAYHQLAASCRLYTYYGRLNVTAGVVEYDIDQFFVGQLCGAQCVDILRLAFIDSTGKSFALQPSDPFTYDMASGNTSATPSGYSVVTVSDTRKIRLHPTPSANGKLECLYSGYGLDLDGQGTFMTIPDEASQFVKWGGIGMLLAYEGQGHDPVRAEYCRQRFADGVEVCKMLTGDNYA